MRHCWNKVDYPTKEEAEAAALVESKRLGQRLQAYRCGPHQCWHIGRRGHGMGTGHRRSHERRVH